MKKLIGLTVLLLLSAFAMNAQSTTTSLDQTSSVSSGFCSQVANMTVDKCVGWLEDCCPFGCCGNQSSVTQAKNVAKTSTQAAQSAFTSTIQSCASKMGISITECCPGCCDFGSNSSANCSTEKTAAKE